MIPVAISVLSAISFAGVAWYILSGVKVKEGWQTGRGPFAAWLDAKRRAKFDAQLPEALSTMSNSLKAGYSISQAFDAVAESMDAPASEEFAILQSQLRIGMDFEKALESMSARVGSEDLSLVTTAILVGRKTGGNLMEIFSKISQTILARMAIERKVKTLTAQGRMQGILISAMPFLLGIAMTVLKPETMLPFLCSFAGAVSVAAVAILVAVGWFAISKITHIDI